MRGFDVVASPNKRVLVSCRPAALCFPKDKSIHSIQAYPHTRQQPPLARQQPFMQQPSQPQQVFAGEKPPAQAYHQPQAMPGMVVTPGGGGNRNAKNLPMDTDGREWSHGLFDCFSDIGTCLIATFLPCIVYAQNKQRYEHLSAGKPDPERGGSGLNGDGLMHGGITCCCGAGWILQIPLRGNIRSSVHCLTRNPAPLGESQVALTDTGFKSRRQCAI
ncbi:hypothetical protein AB1N83_008272 [Pleurotus pulmonarius]